MGHVYVAYREEDGDFVDGVIEQIEFAGFVVWPDHERFSSADFWRETTDQAIRDAFAVIVVFTPAALLSPQITYEWTFALGVGATVIGISRAPVTLPPQLARVHVLDFEPEGTPPWGLLIRMLHTAQNRPRPAEGRAGGLARRSDPESGATPFGPSEDRPSFLDRIRRAPTPSPDLIEPGDRAGDRYYGDRASNRLGDRLGDRLSDGLGDRERPQDVPLDAPDAIARLNAMLESGSSREYRIAVARRLGETGDKAAVPVLSRLLRESDWRVRDAGAAALGQIKAANAVVALLEGLRFWRPGPFGGSGNNQPLLDAIRAIGPVGVPVLVDALGDEEPRIRLHVVEILSDIGEIDALPGLADALRDSEWRVRLQAAEGLGKLRCEEVVGDLVALLRDSTGDVRMAAAGALGQIGSAAAVPGLVRLLRDREWRVRWTAAEALWLIGEASVPELIEALLRDEGEMVRSAAMQSLAAIGRPAIPALIAVLHDPDWDHQLAAAETLASMGAPAVPALIEALHEGDWHMGWMVVEALKRIGTPEALAAVAEWREDDTPDG